MCSRRTRKKIFLITVLFCVKIIVFFFLEKSCLDLKKHPSRLPQLKKKLEKILHLTFYQKKCDFFYYQQQQHYYYL